MMQAAQHAAARGFWVFPLGPCSKKPALPDTDWRQLATRDPRAIENLWRPQPYNIGIACGPSGLHVIDLDNGRGDQAPPPWTGARHGRDVLARLAVAAGAPYPGPTYHVATPSGGEHLYFTAPRTLQLRNTAGRLGWRIDTRGVGGYIVGAGSVLAHGRYRLLDDRSPIALPNWLIDALRPPPPPPARTIDLAQHTITSYVEAALSKQHKRITTAPRGQRHSTLISAASSIGRLVRADMLTYGLAHRVLRDAANVHIGIDGFTEHEAETTIKDGLDFGITRAAPLTLRR